MSLRCIVTENLFQLSPFPFHLKKSVQTYHPRHLPGVSSLLPHTYKLIWFRQVVIFLVINKPVQADLYRAEAGYGIYFDASGYQDAGYLTANVFFDGIQQGLF